MRVAARVSLKSVTVLLQSGLDIGPIVTHRFAWHDFQKGFDAMLSGDCGKVVSKRLKKRKSFVYAREGFRIDFTVASLVNKSKGAKETYEIEMEMEKAAKDVDTLEFFQQAIRLLGKGDAPLASLKVY